MTETNDGWIEWRGGNCPLVDDVPVAVKFRCGSESDKATSDSWRWHHAKDGGINIAYDIVAYRLLPPVAASADDAKSVESIISQFPQGVQTKTQPDELDRFTHEVWVLLNHLAEINGGQILVSHQTTAHEAFIEIVREYRTELADKLMELKQ